MKIGWILYASAASIIMAGLTYDHYAPTPQDTKTPIATTPAPITPKVHTRLLYLDQFNSDETHYDIRRLDGEAIGHHWRFSPLRNAQFEGKTVLYFYHYETEGDREITVIAGYQNGEPYKNQDGADAVLVDIIPKEDREKLLRQLDGNVHGNIFFWPLI